MKTIFLFLFLPLLSLYSRAQTVAQHHLSSCDASSIVELLQQRIVSRKVANDTLYLTVGFVHDCCISLEPTIRSSNDTLYLSMRSTADYICPCHCCYEMDMMITGVTDTNFILIFRGEELKLRSSKYPPLPEQYGITKKTPSNQFNAENQKIGLWRTYYKHSRKIQKEEYYVIDDSGYYLAWARNFDKKGNIVSVKIETGEKGTQLDFDAAEYELLLKEVLH